MVFKMKYKNLEEIVEQLHGASKMHKGQAKKLEKHINDMESAIKDIEKYKKGLSNHPDVMDILKKANEETILEGEELNEGRVMIAVDKKTKKKWQFSGGMTVKHDGKTYDTEGVSMQQVLELSSRQGDIKLGKKDVESGFASGAFSVVDDGSVYQPWKN